MLEVRTESICQDNGRGGDKQQLLRVAAAAQQANHVAPFARLFSPHCLPLQKPRLQSPPNVVSRALCQGAGGRGVQARVYDTGSTGMQCDDAIGGLGVKVGSTSAEQMQCNTSTGWVTRRKSGAGGSAVISGWARLFGRLVVGNKRLPQPASEQAGISLPTCRRAQNEQGSALGAAQQKK